MRKKIEELEIVTNHEGREIYADKKIKKRINNELNWLAKLMVKINKKNGYGKSVKK